MVDRRAVGLSMGALFILVGCGDPIVGTWRSEDPTACAIGTEFTEFTIDGDLTGHGEVCGCSFDFDIESLGDDDYEADVEFGVGCLAVSGSYACTIEGDGDQLDCGLLGEYTRQ